MSGLSRWPARASRFTLQPLAAGVLLAASSGSFAEEPVSATPAMEQEAKLGTVTVNARRREETAATRSLLNTAKVMEDNPVALRMKELETLERVAERIDKISVFGGLDQVLNGLVKMR